LLRPCARRSDARKLAVPVSMKAIRTPKASPRSWIAWSVQL
jgi:hypothetical protein